MQSNVNPKAAAAVVTAAASAEVMTDISGLRIVTTSTTSENVDATVGATVGACLTSMDSSAFVRSTIRDVSEYVPFATPRQVVCDCYVSSTGKKLCLIGRGHTGVTRNVYFPRDTHTEIIKAIHGLSLEFKCTEELFRDSVAIWSLTESGKIKVALLPSHIETPLHVHEMTNREFIHWVREAASRDTNHPFLLCSFGNYIEKTKQPATAPISRECSMASLSSSEILNHMVIEDILGSDIRTSKDQFTGHIVATHAEKLGYNVIFVDIWLAIMTQMHIPAYKGEPSDCPSIKSVCGMLDIAYTSDDDLVTIAKIMHAADIIGETCGRIEHAGIPFSMALYITTDGLVEMLKHCN